MGVAHKAGEPTYSDLVELLLLEWMQSVGLSVEEG